MDASPHDLLGALYNAGLLLVSPAQPVNARATEEAGAGGGRALRGAIQPLLDDRLQAAVPALRTLDEQLKQVLLASVTVETPTAVAASLWQIAKALNFLVDACSIGSGREQAPILTGGGEALEQAAGELRQA